MSSLYEDIKAGLKQAIANEKTENATNDVITIPFKIGDTVWKVEDVWYLDDRKTWTYHYEKEVVEFMIRSISISCNSKGIWTKKFRICEIRDGKVIDRQQNIEFDDFGVTVFSVREQAEKSLKDEFDR